MVLAMLVEVSLMKLSRRMGDEEVRRYANDRL